MKKNVLFLVLALISLVFVSCEKSELGVVIEPVGKNYLVLKPQPLTTKSGFKKLFLRKSNDRYDWYKKVDTTYQLYSLRSKQGKYLNHNLAYEIIDTVYAGETYKHKELETAYLNGSMLLDTKREREPLTRYLWTKTKFSTQDSLLNYNAQTKSFFVSKTDVESEIKTDLGPIITFLFFLIFVTFFVSGNRIWWMREIRQKIIFSIFGQYSFKAEHILNSIILFTFVFVFNSAFCLIYNYLEIWAAIFFAAILSSVILIIFQITHWIDKRLNKLIKKPDSVEIFSFILIMLTYQIELIVFGVTEKFVLYSTISLALFFLVFDIHSNTIASSGNALTLVNLIEKFKRQKEMIGFLKKDDQ